MKIDPTTLDIQTLAPLFAAFEESGARLLYVGGCIRNAVRGVAATDIDLSTDQVRQKANFNYLLENGDLFLDIHPFKNWFKICVGGSYNFQHRTLVGLSLQDTVYAGEDGDDPDDLGDFILYPDDLGFVNIDFLWNNINPYVGLGFSRAVPKKRVGFSVDFGVNYIGKITIEAEDSGMLVYDDYQSRSLEESLDTYRWLPRLQFALSVSL